MSVRAYLTAPIALGWTLIGVVSVGVVVAGAFTIGAYAARSPVVADPTVLDGLGGFLITIVFAALTAAVAGVVWLPCSLGIAAAVTHRSRDRNLSFGDSVELLKRRPEPLYRWVKTRIAFEPIGDRLLTEDDVSPAEVAVGSGAFVIPALALDGPTLQRAVGRANRAVPQSGRERTIAVGIVITGLFVVGAVWIGALGIEVLSSRKILALGAVVVGFVITAALDTVWRAEAYARQDLDAGFQ